MGSVEESERPWARCAAKAGLGPESQLHTIGDGAPWIAHQIDRQFGTQGTYFVDFFHLCEYLSEAAKVCAANDPQAGLAVQKDRLKVNQTPAILETWVPFIQAENDNDPVTACDR